MRATTYTPKEPTAPNITNMAVMAKPLLERASQVFAHVTYVVNESFF